MSENEIYVLEYLNGISENDFNEIIDKNPKVIVDCFAEWCGPCKMMKPIFKELSKKYKEKIKFITIDVDNCNWINQKYDIDSVPRFLFFENGKLIFEQKGASSPESFEFKIRDIMLKEKFTNFHELENIDENKLNEIVKQNDKVVIYIYKDVSELNPIFKPIFILNSEKYKEIFFSGASISKNSWLTKKFGIKEIEYEEFHDKDKKLPYLLFYKNGKLLLETGIIPPDNIEILIKDKMLESIKVEYFLNGIDEQKFQKIIEENEIVIVDIFTTWCGPCKMMKPIFEQLAQEYEKVKFISIDLDETKWLSDHPEYGTNSIPTFLFFKNKRLIRKQIGGMSKSNFEQIIKKELLKD